jgi:hypothetical protein
VLVGLDPRLEVERLEAGVEMHGGVLNLVFACIVQATDDDGSELVRQTAVRVGVRLLFFEGHHRRLECRVPADHGLRWRGTSIGLVRYCGESSENHVDPAVTGFLPVARSTYRGLRTALRIAAK